MSPSTLFSVHYLWVLQGIVLFALLNQPVMLETLWTIVSTLSSSQRYLYRSPTPPTANMFDAIQRSVDKPSTETCAAGGSESLNRSISQYLCCLKILFSEPVRKWRSPSWDKVPSSTSITIHFSTDAILTTSKFDVYRVDKTIVAESKLLDLMQAFMRSPFRRS